MADLELVVARAVDGLPEMCAITGGEANGAIALKTPRTLRRPSTATISVPLNEKVFNKWARRQAMHLKARLVAVLLTVAGIVVAIRNPRVGLVVIAAAVVVHLADLWAERGAARLRPQLQRQGSSVLLCGVHDDFAEAVIASNGGQRAEPAAS